MKIINIFFIIISTSSWLIAERSWAEITLASMSRDQKIGQVLMAAVPTDPTHPNNRRRLAELNLPTYLNQAYVEDMIRTYHIGGILYICEGTINQNVKATNHFQRLSQTPLLVAADFEPGLIRLLDAIKYPRNMTLAATHNADLIEQVGQAIGRQAKALGVHVVFAPVADVNNNPQNPVINDRSLGEDQDAVSTYAVACMKGLQKAGIIACGKHFPGHGDTDIDSHLALPKINHNRDRFESLELVPFKALIQNNIQSMMVAHLMVPALDAQLPTSLSPSAIQLLKDLGHEGLIFSDGMIMQALTKHFSDGQAELNALQAGVHMLVFPADVPQAFNRIKQALEIGELSAQVLDAAVMKILQAKESLKLHVDENRFVREDGVVDKINNSQSYALKKQIYQEALTLIRNESLPVYSTAGMAMVQIGGAQYDVWSDAFKQKNIPSFFLSSHPTDDELAQLAASLQNYKKIMIGLFDMNKFASQGFGIDSKVCDYIQRLRKQAQISLVLFGSPYALKLFTNIPTILEAYEPDIDAQAAAIDVMFGKYKAVGTLPVSADE